MLYVKRLVMSMLILISLSAEAEEVLGVETFNGENVVMLCVEGKVYVDLYNALVKTNVITASPTSDQATQRYDFVLNAQTRIRGMAEAR
jgi:hypothetical protein